MPWDAALSFLIKLLDVAKVAFAFFFIRKSARTEVHKKQLEKANEIKDQQLEMASRPPASPSDVRDELHNDRL